MSNSYEKKVNEQIERLKAGDYRTIEHQVAQKRIAWFKQNDLKIDTRQKLLPRSAYELLFFDYMGLSEDDLPVIKETDQEIVWLSLNPCPTLDACQALELDTKSICRAVYEKSTQALISQLDPQLRFLRSYTEIRPYTAHCKEMIVRVDFEEMMTLAIEEARLSKQEGNKGYGAVVTLGNQVIGKAHNTAITEKDPSLHAEVNAIRQAEHTLGDSNLSGAILFSTCEPCPMCSSLAVWANLSSIVYGVSIQETVQLGKSRIEVSAQEIIERSPLMIEVIGDVLKEECKSLYA
ncbi:MAG: nucleoside deaminase [Anaerolineaceae bacterium]|nr:nucleoside deaminase [Anaerolineaceae bacterium]